MKLRSTRTCRRDRPPWFLRALNFLRFRHRTTRCGDFYLDEPPPGMGALNFLRFRHRTTRCGDFYLDEPPPGMGVREPRRPHPSAPGGAAVLELPQSDLGWSP
jgi:hypothetical protein